MPYRIVDKLKTEGKSDDEVKPVLEELGMSEYSFEAVGEAYPEDLQQAAA